MRGTLFAIIAAGLLAACAPSADRCSLSLTRNVSFSAPNAADTITTRSLGPSCDKAIGQYEIRSEDGAPIWSWSAPLPQTFGDVFPADKPAQMHEFLERWAQPTLSLTQEAPAWPLLAPGQTTLDQLTYEDIRARNLPMLCHASGSRRQVCIFWEPIAGGAGHFYDRNYEEGEP
jgi:hypothetical protein